MTTNAYKRTDVAVRTGTGLTERRQQVMELLAQGYRNKEIAEKLQISEATVKCHLEALYGVFTARNAADLVSQGWIHGIYQARAAAHILMMAAILTCFSVSGTSEGRREPPIRNRVVRTSCMARVRCQEISA